MAYRRRCGRDDITGSRGAASWWLCTMALVQGLGAASGWLRLEEGGPQEELVGSGLLCTDAWMTGRWLQLRCRSVRCSHPRGRGEVEVAGPTSR